ncbi:MAG: hypothetical protein ACE5K1_04825 [Acidiferrobacterales bacterium]
MTRASFALIGLILAAPTTHGASALTDCVDAGIIMHNVAMKRGVISQEKATDKVKAMERVRRMRPEVQATLLENVDAAYTSMRHRTPVQLATHVAAQCGIDAGESRR